MSERRGDREQSAQGAGRPIAPNINGIDHIHVFVTDRAQACRWYSEVLGLMPVAHFAAWADDGGPLTVGSADGSVHLALFERPAATNRATIALGVSGPALLRWQSHLQNVLGITVALVDHQLSWSLYFSDPDGNPFEVTSTEYESVQRLLAA